MTIHKINYTDASSVFIYPPRAEPKQDRYRLIAHLFRI